ncbi:MAG: hypothetical protein FWG59_00710 [Betaproteobacteria bacterium]|nr:hypothetical protein [Betaproteobacteria bacterium]
MRTPHVYTLASKRNGTLYTGDTSKDIWTPACAGVTVTYATRFRVPIRHSRETAAAGEERAIPAHNAVKFTTGKALKESV